MDRFPEDVYSRILAMADVSVLDVSVSSLGVFRALRALRGAELREDLKYGVRCYSPLIRAVNSALQPLGDLPVLRRDPGFNAGPFVFLYKAAIQHYEALSELVEDAENHRQVPLAHLGLVTGRYPLSGPPVDGFEAVL